MRDLISRQAAIDAIMCEPTDAHYPSWYAERLEHLPPAQPELPKQFMSDDCISRSELYKKVCEAEKLARERVLDTPSDSPFPNNLNPAYTRYSAQLNERTQFKYMIADARSVQPEQRWIPCEHELPEDYTDVLVWFEYFRYGDYNCLYQTYGIGSYNTEYDSWMINHETGWHKLRVVAWTPLPEPYKGGEQDG